VTETDPKHCLLCRDSVSPYKLIHSFKKKKKKKKKKVFYRFDTKLGCWWIFWMQRVSFTSVCFYMQNCIGYKKRGHHTNSCINKLAHSLLALTASWRISLMQSIYGCLISSSITELETSVGKLQKEVEQLREQRNQQKQLADSSARQRDMYKTLLTQSTGFSLPPQGDTKMTINVMSSWWL